MALAERIDHAADFRFGVEIEGLVVGWFAECGGLSIEREILAYKEGGLNAYAHQLPGRVKSTDITLKRGVAEWELWRWFRKGLYDLQVERRNVSIILYGGDRAERERWDLTEVFPVQWNGPELNAEGNAVAVETLRIGRGSDPLRSPIQRAPDNGQPASVTAAGRPGPSNAAIELPLLAGKVYELLRQELRWERERMGRGPIRRR
jgi:phage tail-like protein